MLVIQEIIASSSLIIKDFRALVVVVICSVRWTSKAGLKNNVGLVLLKHVK